MCRSAASRLITSSSGALLRIKPPGTVGAAWAGAVCAGGAGAWAFAPAARNMRALLNRILFMLFRLLRSRKMRFIGAAFFIVQFRFLLFPDRRAHGAGTL